MICYRINTREIQLKKDLDFFDWYTLQKKFGISCGYAPAENILTLTEDGQEEKANKIFDKVEKYLKKLEYC